MIREEEAITYFESAKKRLEDFRKIYPSPDIVGYQATTKEISFYDMAISALSAEPCEDCVSREEVYKITLNESMKLSLEQEHKIRMTVRDLPSVQPMRFKGEWTPISSVEELPEECLWVTRKGKDYCFVELIGWDGYRKCRTEDGGFRCSSDLKDVVAYMPYFEPEPYKEG